MSQLQSSSQRSHDSMYSARRSFPVCHPAAQFSEVAVGANATELVITVGLCWLKNNEWLFTQESLHDAIFTEFNILYRFQEGNENWFLTIYSPRPFPLCAWNRVHNTGECRAIEVSTRLVRINNSNVIGEYSTCNWFSTEYTRYGCVGLGYLSLCYTGLGFLSLLHDAVVSLAMASLLFIWV